MDKERQIQILQEKLENLNRTMGRFQLQIMELRQEIEVLKQDPSKAQTEKNFEPNKKPQNIDNQVFTTKEPANPIEANPPIEPKKELSTPFENSNEGQNPSAENSVGFNLEDYIGGNLISKIGILILIIGIGVFVNYAIEHNLISPLGRVVLAYLAGGILIGLAYWLKPTYKAYSAVLFSGGVAVMYFTTYLAYAFFDLIPQGFAFALMLVFTLYTVFEATRYDEEIIGMIGLVGAYAVPFLLSNDSGKPIVLFIYMTIINLGVLVLAFRRDWQRMNILAFGMSWLIMLTWLGIGYQLADFYVAWGFSFVFFGVFYVALVVHQVTHQQKFSDARIFILLINSVLFYGIGIVISGDIARTNEINIFQISNISNYFFGFTLFNWLIHSLVSIYLYKQKQADKQVIYFSMGLAILFLTLAVPIYFQTELLTLFWIIETVLLFALSRRERIIFLEQASWLLALISTVSMAFTLENEWMSYSWLAETFLLFVVARRLNSPFFENLAYWVAIASAFSVPFFFGAEWIIGFWLIETLLLFGVGRYQQAAYFENISLGLWAAILISLGNLSYQHYWLINTSFELFPIYNSIFLTTLLSIIGLGIYLFIHFKFPFIKPETIDNQEVNNSQENPQTTSTLDSWEVWLGKDRIYLGNYFSFLILALLYELGLGEIWRYFQVDYLSRAPIMMKSLTGEGQLYEHVYKEILIFGQLWLFFYSAVFGLLLVGLTKWFSEQKFYATISSVFVGLFTIFYLTLGLAKLYELRQIYLFEPKLYEATELYVVIRFGLYLAVLGLLLAYFWANITKRLLDEHQQKMLSVYLNLVVLITLSFELANLLVLNSLQTEEAVNDAENTAFKLGFTLLWAVYSLGLIGYGIWRKRKFLRLLGIGIFGVTLVKLFINDVNYSSSLIVIFAFIGVGILLLITAFLYQKYKNIILADDEK